jgi:hypothetical protein
MGGLDLQFHGFQFRIINLLFESDLDCEHPYPKLKELLKTQNLERFFFYFFIMNKLK